MFDNIARAQETQLRILDAFPARVFDNIARAQETQLRVLDATPTELFINITKMYETQLSAVAAMPRVNVGFVTGTYLSLISEALQVIENSNSRWIGKEKSDSQDKIQSSQKLENREFAAWLTVISFLIVYISCMAAIRYDSNVAEISATDGPNPFEAAMAVGALVFWVCMNRPGGSSDK